MLSLTKRNTIYYARFRVPSDLLHYFQRAEIIRSLHTKRYKLAKVVFNRMVGETERICSTIRAGVLTTLEISSLVKQALQFPIDSNHLKSNFTSALSAIEMCPTDNPKLKDLRNQLDLIKSAIVKEYMEGVNSGFGGNSFGRSKSHSLNETIQAFIHDKKAGRRKRQEKANKVMECLQYETGKKDILLSDINYDITRRIAERLLKYPIHRNLKYKGVSLDDVYKLPDARYPSKDTQTEELFYLSSLYNFAIKKMDGLQRNFAEGLVEKLVESDGKKPSEYRDVFHIDDIQEILRELSERNRNGEFRNNPHLLLIPLMGLYQGMRANEICQLYLADIAEIDGRWCISTNEDIDGKSVKNENSRRVNPIHPILIEFGLIRFWTIQKSKGYYLIKNIIYHDKYDHYLSMYKRVKNELIGWFANISTTFADTNNHLVQPIRLFGSKTKNPNYYTHIFKITDKKSNFQDIASLFEIEIPDEEDSVKFEKLSNYISSKNYREKVKHELLKSIAFTKTYIIKDYHFNFDEFKEKILLEEQEYLNSTEYKALQQYYYEEKQRKAKEKENKLVNGNRKNAQALGRLSQYNQFKDMVYKVAKVGNRRNCLYIFWHKSHFLIKDENVIISDFYELANHLKNLSNSDKLYDKQISSIVSQKPIPLTNLV